MEVLSLTDVIIVIGMYLTERQNKAEDILFNFPFGLALLNYLNIYFIHLRIESKIEIFK